MNKISSAAITSLIVFCVAFGALVIGLYSDISVFDQQILFVILAIFVSSPGGIAIVAAVIAGAVGISFVIGIVATSIGRYLKIDNRGPAAILSLLLCALIFMFGLI